MWCREYSASVIAANTVLRSLFSMAFPLFGRAMYDSLTPEWAGSLLGMFGVFVSFVVEVLMG